LKNIGTKWNRRALRAGRDERADRDNREGRARRMMHSDGLSTQRSWYCMAAGVLLWVLFALHCSVLPDLLPQQLVLVLTLASLSVAGLSVMLRREESLNAALRDSWGARLTLIFCVATLISQTVRQGAGGAQSSSARGWIVGGMLVFVGPACWRHLARAQVYPAGPNRILSHVADATLPLALFVTLSSAVQSRGWIPAAAGTAFVPLALLGSAWALTVGAVKWAVVGGRYNSRRSRDRYYRWVLVVYYAAMAFWALTLALDMRRPAEALGAGGFVDELGFAPALLLGLCAAWICGVGVRTAVGWSRTGGNAAQECFFDALTLLGTWMLAPLACLLGFSGNWAMPQLAAWFWLFGGALLASSTGKYSGGGSQSSV
jgi:hypothetical protein